MDRSGFSGTLGAPICFLLAARITRSSYSASSVSR